MPLKLAHRELLRKDVSADGLGSLCSSAGGEAHSEDRRSDPGKGVSCAPDPLQPRWHEAVPSLDQKALKPSRIDSQEGSNKGNSSMAVPVAGEDHRSSPGAGRRKDH